MLLDCLSSILLSMKMIVENEFCYSYHHHHHHHHHH